MIPLDVNAIAQLPLDAKSRLFLALCVLALPPPGSQSGIDCDIDELMKCAGVSPNSRGYAVLCLREFERRGAVEILRANQSKPEVLSYHPIVDAAERERQRRQPEFRALREARSIVRHCTGEIEGLRRPHDQA